MDCPDCTYWQNKYIQANAEKRELEQEINTLIDNKPSITAVALIIAVSFILWAIIILGIWGLVS